MRATDCDPPALGTVVKTPESYWEPGGMRRHPVGVVWVAFDNGVGAPWDTAHLEVVE